MSLTPTFPWRWIPSLGAAALALPLCGGAASADRPAPEPRWLEQPPVFLEAEPNDSPATATPIPAGGLPVAVGYGATGWTGDVDYWTFVACPGCQLYAWLDTGGIQYGNTRVGRLELYAADGTTLIERDEFGGVGTGGDLTIETENAALITGRVLNGGRHYLRVEPVFSLERLNPYRLHVALVGIGGVESEPNDTLALADPHPMYAALSGTLSSSSDVDYFAMPEFPGHRCMFVDGDPDQDGSSTHLTLDIRDVNDNSVLLINGALPGDARTGEGACAFLRATQRWLRVAATSGSSGSYRIFIVPAEGASLSRIDFERDFRQDIAVWRPSTGTWYVLRSIGNWSLAPLTVQWGTAGDIPVGADYDGDGVTDAAVFRPSSGVWYIRRSSNTASPLVLQWGQTGDLPRPGDFDGDGLADPAVFRPATGQWFVLKSTTGYATTLTATWGTNGDVPVVADHDADGRADFAVWRPSNGAWYRTASGRGYAPLPVVVFGTAGDMPVLQEDFYGVVLSLFRPSTGQWFGWGGGTQWGQNGDIPVPGYYNRDNFPDLAVWRPSTGVWYVNRSSLDGLLTRQFGQNGDVPIRDSY